MSSPRQLNPFGDVDLTTWQDKALADLRGRSLESLDQLSEEGLRRKVLYTKEDLAPHSGTVPGGEAKIAQVYHPTDVQSLRVSLARDRELGAHGAFIEAGSLKEELAWTQLLEGLDAVWIATNSPRGELPSCAQFVVDPLAELIAGTSPDWAVCKQQLSGAQAASLRIDLCPWFETGAGPAQELALLAAQGVYLMRELEAQGLSPEAVAKCSLITFCVDTDFFMGLAKLRAARRLWAQVLGACGVEVEARRATIHARAGQRSWAARPDARWGNLLRACTQAFASQLGGADWVALPAFDGGESEEGQRLATNMQVILREESFATEVSDPAAGSYYLESLCRDLQDAAWTRFVEIEAAGGFEAQLKSGDLAAAAREQQARRVAQLATGKRVVVGVNRFITDDPGPQLAPSVMRAAKQRASLPPHRLLADVEALRARGEELHVTMDLLCAGELRRYKARADFARDWFAAGGVALGEPSDQLGSASVMLLCAADGDYGPLIELAKAARSSGVKWIAAITRPGEKEGEDAGLEAVVDAFVHMRADAPKVFSSLFDALKGPQEAS